MKIAFSIALLATVGLAYSVFTNGGLCNGKKGCNLTPTSTAPLSSQCTKGCCSMNTLPPPPAVVSHQDGEKSECSSGKCCSQATSEVALKQDGECSKCEATCSEGKTCCQDSKAEVLVSVAKKQDGEKCCEGSCSEGKTCCQDSKAEVLVSVAKKQDGEKCCEGSCSTGGTCCQKGDATSTVAVKQDGQCAKCPATGALVSTEGKSETCSQDSCCVAEAMKKLPAMTYKVGTESTCCSEAAAQMAEKSKEAIKYVVAGEEFDCKESAYTALVEKTETFVSTFLTPAKCEASGQTTVCEKSFGCCEAAAKQTELVVNATKDIKVGYQVSGKKAGCINCAKSMAEKDNAAIEYVVNGEVTKCELHARLLAAQAKYVAAVKAMASAENTVSAEMTEKTETKSEVKSEG